MAVLVRPANDADRGAVRAVVEAAFPTPAEADLVEALARDGDLVLSLVAEAEGAVQSTDPLVLVAREVEFEVEDAGDGAHNDGEFVEFHGFVQSADVGAGRFTLVDGATVRLTDATVIDPLGDVVTLQAVADALAAGKMVRAEGDAVVESSSPPAALVAATVKWEVDI